MFNCLCLADFFRNHPNGTFRADQTGNDIIAGNGRVLKAYMFIGWLYLYNVNDFYLLSF